MIDIYTKDDSKEDIFQKCPTVIAQMAMINKLTKPFAVKYLLPDELNCEKCWFRFSCSKSTSNSGAADIF